ncbi:hypothetical protein AJ88_40245 [Mesorhizobium amorphae CCBAU 01583]|nr:hypothetical protein AJ88_40245 [Mesorhizobium amorphae CCBAU 01583]
MLGAPPLLIFDESLNGIDPLAAWEIKRIIRSVAASGRHAVIISTHLVEAVPGLCTAPCFWSRVVSPATGTPGNWPRQAAAPSG